MEMHMQRMQVINKNRYFEIKCMPLPFPLLCKIKVIYFLLIIQLAVGYITSNTGGIFRYECLVVSVKTILRGL